MAIWSAMWLSILSGHSALMDHKPSVFSRFSQEGLCIPWTWTAGLTLKMGGNYFVDFVRVHCNLEVLWEIGSKWPSSFFLSPAVFCVFSCFHTDMRRRSKCGRELRRTDSLVGKTSHLKGQEGSLIVDKYAFSSRVKAYSTDIIVYRNNVKMLWNDYNVMIIKITSKCSLDRQQNDTKTIKGPVWKAITKRII